MSPNTLLVLYFDMRGSYSERTLFQALTLTVMGGLLIEVMARRSGRRRITRQICYICKEINGLYLSEACEDLDGVLPLNKEIRAEVGWAAQSRMLGLGTLRLSVDA